MTLGGRIKIGMSAKGIATPAELARRMKLRRQTVTKWVNDEVDFLEPKYLFGMYPLPASKYLGIMESLRGDSNGQAQVHIQAVPSTIP